MQMMIQLLNIVEGPIIGALIGYVTNFIAVKMLFRPLYPVKIGKFTIPFTPGIFPRRKEGLAKALGKAVGHHLLTTEDIEKMLLSEELKEKLIEEVRRFLNDANEQPIKNLLAHRFDQENYSRGKTWLENAICEKIISKTSKLGLGAIIVRESGRVIKEKAEGTLLAFMANDKLIASLVAPIGEKVESYIRENGDELIRPIIHKEIKTLENMPFIDLARKTGIEEEHLLGVVENVYTEFIRKKAVGLIKQFDIPRVVEQKVNAMDALEIERLVLSVMKKELNAIINLGALIGLIIGTCTIFI